jgi:hypothetical protein|nr:MAG TPA: Mature oligodendrocyte transmembrane protein [Caudoviricetes sp.]
MLECILNLIISIFKLIGYVAILFVIAFIVVYVLLAVFCMILALLV